MSHLANPWILARLVLGVLATLLSVAAGVGAVRILLRYRAEGAPDERTLELERQSELIGTVLSVAFTLEIFAAVFTVIASDRLSGSIRGAMCAFGVFGSNPWGARALAGSIAGASACAAWLGTRSIDSRLRRGSLVRSLAGLALLVSACVAADTWASVRYFFGLDLDVVATCCSVFVDSTSANGGVIGHAGERYLELAIAGGAAAIAVFAGVMLARKASAPRGVLMSILGVAGGAFALRAVTDVIAPYVYETPNHQCPYCLLHGDAAPAGPLLLAGIAVAFLTGVATLAVLPQMRRAGAQNAAREVLERLGRMQAVAWAVVLVAGAYPVLRYGVVAGTWELFR